MKFLDNSKHKSSIKLVMFKIFIAFSLLLSVTMATFMPRQESKDAMLTSPLPPDTGTVTPAQTAAVTAEPAELPAAPKPSYPVTLLIPSLSLSNHVIPLGTNAKGEMDVPDGDSGNVGWYQDGTIPGEVGSAVLDAHVFAAFAKLKKLKIGSSVYVVTDTGSKLHFVVSEIKTYALADVPADLLFNRADGARLNLITCAGTLSRDRTTYSHRLVVYTKLVND
jgi:sortase (surface protein transpeptidase)